MKYLPMKAAIAATGLSPSTLRRYADAGKVDYYLTPGGKRMFNVDEMLKKKKPVA